MGTKPLTNKQRNAVADIVTIGRVRALGGGGDEVRARSFLSNAEAVAEDLAIVRNQVTRHDLAYSVVHDVGEAMLAAYGYRTDGDEGGHQSVILFLAAVFNIPPESDAAVRCEMARERRNSRYYRAYQPSKAETDQLVADAALLLLAGQAQLPS